MQNIKREIPTKDLIGFLLVISTIALVIFGVRYVSGVLTPLFIAFIFAIILRPVFEFIKFLSTKLIQRFFKTTDCNNLFCNIIFYFITMLIPIFAIIFIYSKVGATISEQISRSAPYILEKYEVLSQLLTAYLGKEGIGVTQIKDYLDSLRNPTGENVKPLSETKKALIEIMPSILSSLTGSFFGGMGAISKSLFAFVVNLATWIVLPQFVFYMMSNKLKKENIENSISFFLAKDTTANKTLTTKILLFRDVISSYFQKQTIAVILYGLIYWFALTCTGSTYALEIAVIFSLLNYFPNFGTISFILLSVTMFYSGIYSLYEFTSLIVVAIVAYLIDEMLLTKLPFFKGLINHQVHSGVLIFFILFWGAILNGLLGMLLAVPLTIFFKMVNENKKEISQYLRNENK